MTTYAPLHAGLTIRESSIHGLGVFTLVDLPAAEILGISHVCDRTNGRYHQDYIRTPIGGMINHSDAPNCRKISVQPGATWTQEIFGTLPEGAISDTMAIETTRQILAGEELTVTYTIYRLEDDE